MCHIILTLFAGRGRRIIHDIWNALKPGGLLIYSTCTYNTEEDEENVHHITEELGAEALPIPAVKDEWQITGPLKYNHPVYRFFPHKTKGEGFFLAALRKADGEAEEIRFKNKNKKEKGKTAPAIPKAVKSFLSDTSSFSPEWSGSILRMLPESVRGAYPLLREHLRILSAGICIGEAKGKDFIPAEELALSTALRPDAFPVADLDWDDAIRYLKKEALLLPAGTEKGYVLVRHKKFPLGFAKHLGNRATQRSWHWALPVRLPRRRRRCCITAQRSPTAWATRRHICASTFTLVFGLHLGGVAAARMQAFCV